MELLFSTAILKSLLPLLAIIAGIFVISTKNAIISVFNLIVLYILVAFYLIYIGITYLGISYIIIYIGAIAILFLFIIMMIDVEVVEKRSNNYLPLLFLLLSGFFFTLRKILHNIGLIKMKSFRFKEELIFIDNMYGKLFYNDIENSSDFSKTSEENKNDVIKIDLNLNNHHQFSYKIIDEIDKNNKKVEGNSNDIFSHYITDNYPNVFDEFVLLRENESEYNFKLNNRNIFSENKDTLNLIKSKDNKEINVNNWTFINDNNYILKKNILIENLSPSINYPLEIGTNYLLVIPNWDSAINRITQITAIGDVLYTVYHSYIYILSIILLLGMVGAIILTAENTQEIKTINILKSKKSSIISYYIIYICRLYYKNLLNKKNIIMYSFFNKMKKLIFNFIKFFSSFNNIKRTKKSIGIPSFFHTYNSDYLHSEDILGNLIYFILANLIIALLLLGINYYFSLSIKYLEKGGGFECGFTSFVQTRERFNVIFYRVSLLFLVFDLEIILAFPYTAIYQKNENISKNNVLAFLYILIVGFIYELKEGALNIIKKAHISEINNNK